MTVFPLMMVFVFPCVGVAGYWNMAAGRHQAAVLAAVWSMGEKIAALPDPESLLLMGTALFCGAGLCVYRAARAKRSMVRTSSADAGPATGFGEREVRA